MGSIRWTHTDGETSSARQTEKEKGMKDKIHLERTEAGGQITWIPRSRIFVTIQEFEEKEKECEMLREINRLLIESVANLNEAAKGNSKWRNVAGIMHEFIQEGDCNGAKQHYEEECRGW